MWARVSIESGYNIAQRWLPMVEPGGHVMLSIATPGSLNLQPRLDGYIQAIKDAGDPVTYETLDSGVDQATELSRIEAYYLANPEVAGMFGTGATDSLAGGPDLPEVRSGGGRESSRPATTCYQRPSRSSPAAT